MQHISLLLQETALYGEFSIRETMMYFGWIFSMGTSEINERLQFLLNFLDLPSENRLVKNLRSAHLREAATRLWRTNLMQTDLIILI